MPVAFDAANSAASFGSGSISLSHTASGADRYVFALALVSGGNSITGITYGGTAMTLIRPLVDAAWYGLVNPPTGSQSVVASHSGTDERTLIVASYTGVDQTTPYTGLADSSGSGTSASRTVTSETDALVVAVLETFLFGAHTHTPTGSSQTQRASVIDGNGFGRTSLTDQPGASSVTASWTISTSASRWDIAAVSLNPPAAPPPEPETPERIRISFRAPA